MKMIVGNKFQLKFTILIFLDQVCPKGVIPVKNPKSGHHY